MKTRRLIMILLLSMVQLWAYGSILASVRPYGFIPGLWFHFGLYLALWFHFGLSPLERIEFANRVSA